MTTDRKIELWDVFDALVEDIDERAHCRQVAMPFDGDITLFPVALFHDLIEDGYIELSDLVQLAKLEPSQKEALDAITRRKNERYFVYIRRVKENEFARKVKIADLVDNIKRCVWDLEKRWSLLLRYIKAYAILTGQWDKYRDGTLQVVPVVPFNNIVE